jgi:predicted DNA-binding transcriptional regulator AlpA
MPEIVYRRNQVREFFGNPPWATFYARIKSGDIPAPDFQLGPQTPGWTQSTIERAQAARIKQQPANR